MPNPFLFGKIVTGEHFCNRTKELHLLLENLSGGQSVVVISTRRMGKSSLLAEVSRKLDRKGFVCGRIDYFALNSVAKILGETVRVCAEMMLAHDTNLRRFLASMGDIFKRTRIAIEPSPDGSISIKPDLGLPVDVRTSLTEAVEGLERILAKRDRRGLLVLDEFQEIAAIDKSEQSSLEAEFRTVMQSAKQLSFAFLGSRAAMLTEMFTQKKRPFFQAAKIVKLGPIDRKSLKAFIQNRFASVGITIENLDPVLELVEGHPDYTQRYCSHLYDILAARARMPAKLYLDETLLDHTLSELIDRSALMFVPQWEAYTLRQRQVLSLLAEIGPLRRVSAVDLAEYNMTHTSFNTALKKMLRRAVVQTDADGRYRVADPILRRWITRQAGRKK